MCDGDGVLFLHHSVLTGFTARTVSCPVYNGSSSHGSKSGWRVILITHSRSTLTFGKDGDYAKASSRLQGKASILTPSKHKLRAEIWRFVAFACRATEHELLDPPTFPRQRNSDLYSTFAVRPGERRRKGDDVKWHSLWVVFGCTRFLSARTATICGLSWFYSVPSTNTWKYVTCASFPAPTNHRPAPIYFLTVPLNKPQLINAI